MTTEETARLALACLDLTSLNDADTPADIDKLCARAQSRFGNTAAVCVWPRFAAQARGLLPASIAVAAVANFPPQVSRGWGRDRRAFALTANGSGASTWRQAVTLW